MTKKTTLRDASLREMLTDRRREMLVDVQNRIRHGRADRANEVRDELEISDADIQGDIELAVLQMRAANVTRIEEALVRLDAGHYGSCAECEEHISERRLRAMPFAVRCQACEERREEEQGQVRELAQRRGRFLFPDAVSS
jgi:DnaK suppressor protein